MADHTQDDLDRINAAIAGSELSVQFADGRRVQYRSLDELLRAKHTIKASLANDAGQRPARAFRLGVRKGI